MVRSLQAITLSQVKMDRREGKKKSILSRLSSKGGALLRRRKPIQVPLCQELERWEPKTPSLHQKNPNGSSLLKGTRRDEVNLETMVQKDQRERHTTLLPGKRLHSQQHKQSTTGGFSIFMFRPLDSNHSSNQKSRIMQVKSMFQSTDLDENFIKYFVKNDFYVAYNLSVYLH